MFYAIRNNSSYILILALWSGVGMLSTPFAIVIILINLLLFFRKERYYEALFGFLFLLVLSDNTQELWSFAKVVKPYYLILFSSLILAKYQTLISDTRIFKNILPYLIFAIFCLTFSRQENFFIGLQKTLSYSLIFISIPNIVSYEYKRIGKEFFANIIAFSIIIYLIGLSVILTFPEVGISHGGRWKGAFGNPNGLGIYLIVFYTLYRIVKHEFPTIFTKRESIFYLTLTFLLVWMCGSRTALLSILAFEITYKGFLYSKGLTLILLCSILVYFNQLYELIISALINLGLSDSLRLDNLESGSGRIIAWSFAWQHIWENTLILGKGLGYDEWLMRKNFNMLSKLGHEGGVHNSYLIVWLNTGLIGLILFLGGLFKLFIEGAKNKRYAFPLMLAVLISANFEPWITSSLNPYTVILIISITIMLQININNEKETSLETATH